LGWKVSSTKTVILSEFAAGERAEGPAFAFRLSSLFSLRALGVPILKLAAQRKVLGWDHASADLLTR
jgi:hypothetical protein